MDSAWAGAWRDGRAANNPDNPSGTKRNVSDGIHNNGIIYVIVTFTGFGRALSPTRGPWCGTDPARPVGQPN